VFVESEGYSAVAIFNQIDMVIMHSHWIFHHVNQPGACACYRPRRVSNALTWRTSKKKIQHRSPTRLHTQNEILLVAPLINGVNVTARNSTSDRLARYALSKTRHMMMMMMMMNITGDSNQVKQTIS